MKTLALLCKDVIDHGHCSTSVWKTGDDHATLQLYLLQSEGTPTPGDLLEVDVATGEDEVRSVATLTSRVGPIEPNDDMVICPACTSQFAAVPVNVQHRVQQLEIPTLFPADHEPQPQEPRVEFAECLFLGNPPQPFNDWNAWALSVPRRDVTIIAGRMQQIEPLADTTVVHSDAPPVDNEHVAEGCEQFADPSATHEAVSSLDTPGQILGAAAEHTGSD